MRSGPGVQGEADFGATHEMTSGLDLACGRLLLAGDAFLELSSCGLIIHFTSIGTAILTHFLG